MPEAAILHSDLIFYLQLTFRCRDAVGNCDDGNLTAGKNQTLLCERVPRHSTITGQLSYRLRHTLCCPGPFWYLEPTRRWCGLCRLRSDQRLFVEFNRAIAPLMLQISQPGPRPGRRGYWSKSMLA
jgi:hypothetical protein